jgi:AraC-like DNA-binding protein
MRPIPLISAARVAGFSNLLDAAGVPADRYLDRARISPQIREDPVGFVPGRSVWAFIGEATRGEGMRGFALDAARLSEWRRAGWVRPLAHAATLGDAISAMCSSYPRDVPMVRLGLDLEGSVAWFWRRRVADVRGWDGNEPAEQYMLSFMLELIRAAAGSDWLPERLKLESSLSGWGAATPALLGVRIEYDQPLLAVAIPVPLLSLPICIGFHPECAPEGEPAAADFQGSLRQVLWPWMVGGLPSQEIVAEILGMSPRSLRRWLEEEGVTWRVIVEDLIFAHAIARLQQDRASVREVAEELGYSDTAHFTRFFRRRAGLPPSAYRAQVERATELVRRPQVSGA